MHYSLFASACLESGYGPNSNFLPITKTDSGMDAGIQYQFEAGCAFIAGTPGTTTLTLSHFANWDDATPDKVLTFSVTVPEESLKVKEDPNKFLPVGSDS